MSSSITGTGRSEPSYPAYLPSQALNPSFLKCRRLQHVGCGGYTRLRKPLLQDLDVAQCSVRHSIGSVRV